MLHFHRVAHNLQEINFKSSLRIQKTLLSGWTVCAQLQTGCEGMSVGDECTTNAGSQLSFVWDGTNKIFCSHQAIVSHVLCGRKCTPYAKMFSGNDGHLSEIMSDILILVSL